jgi:hypothetical protein
MLIVTQHPSWVTHSHTANHISPGFHEIPLFITVFTKAWHRFLAWDIGTQSTTSNFIFLRSRIILLTTHVFLVVSSCRLSNQNYVYLYHFHMRATCPAQCYPSWFNDLNNIWAEQITELITMQFYPSSCHFIPLRSILLRAPFSTTHSTCVPCLMLRYQVPQPYKRTDKIILLCILIFTFLHSRRKDKIFGTSW